MDASCTHDFYDAGVIEFKEACYARCNCWTDLPSLGGKVQVIFQTELHLNLSQTLCAYILSHCADNFKIGSKVLKNILFPR